VGLGGVALLLAFVLPPFLLKLAILLAAGAFVGLVLLPRILGPERARTALALFSLAVASMAVALVAGEFVVRLVFADVTTTNDNTSFFARRWRSGLSSNSLGFREREIDPEPAEGVYRIAVIGDSFTWGQGIDRSDRMTERLQALLDHTSGRFEVLNFGLPGRETVDHLRTLRDVVLPLHPDFVLLQWFINGSSGSSTTSKETTRVAARFPRDSFPRMRPRHGSVDIRRCTTC
jgi:hypothetical protein